MEPQDTITIAPNVLITIARHATEQVDGVSHMGQIPVDVGRLLRGNPMGSGVVLEIEEDQKATVDLYISVEPNIVMRDVSCAVQRAVKRAIQDLVGMDVTAVNVHIEDVDYPLGERT
jgi:uncharacterized alkaline shock family protein YloU